MQNIYIRLHTHFEDVRRLENPFGWLVAVSLNVCNDEIRRVIRQQEVCERAFHYELRRRNRADRQLFDERNVESFLNSLPPQAGTLVELHYIQGFSIGELSEISGTARSTVAKRIGLSVGKLRKNVLEKAKLS